MLYITQVIQLIAASCGLLINDLLTLLAYYLKPYIKLKLIGLAIRLYQQF